ncbi:hypothetical protein BCR33DRAFT_716020 [Rhizoclosmatium globosum]|uniref:Uncharacterized protein n=1 Tax=Rhizoclosmatium globosum TaxID=329046 RepID=A0A1Y2CG20_9FUNG|nr:hypothetical protein BCR33DRAFT_716020 [Rhizoclosmatium globosum]|eukprot:ORY46008.1 hypothetical protein BCR33DRAFT_716020 [Rhizoclosmatium globosum]
MKRKDLRFQRCIWSAYGSNLFLLGFGELHILHVSGEVQRLKLPCNRKVRNVVALPENVLVIAFDMDESEIYTQFDIQGHRGWNSSPTELMIAQSDKKSSKIPFNVDLDITSSSLDKSASSLLMVIRVTTIVTELSRIELPILMPDILLYDAGSRVILTGNHSVGTILLYDLLPQGQFESSPKQIIRLESGHFAMGAALSHIASQTNLFILAAGGLVSQATGLSITSMIDVALKVVQYSRSDTQAQNTLVPMTARNNLKETASSHLEKLEIFGQVQDRVFGGMVSCSVDTSLFELKLPGNDRKAIRPIEVIAESVPGEATLQDIVVRLEKLERNQNEILSLLRQLVNNKRN